MTMNEKVIESFNGKKIGVVRGKKMTEELVAWIKKNNAKVELVYMDDTVDLYLKLLNGEIDGFTGAENEADRFEGARPLVLIASPKTYLCARRGATAIFNQLNYALAKIENDDPLFVSNLKKKYYVTQYDNVDLADSETRYVLSHSVIKVGYVLDHMPFCGQNAEGKCVGLIKQLMDNLIYEMGLDDTVTVEYEPFDTFIGMAQAIHDGKIDTGFPVIGEDMYLTEMNIDATSSIIDVPLYIAYTGEYSDAIFDKIAVNTKPIYKIQSDYSNREIIRYKSVRDCVDAVNNGDATCTVLASYVLKSIVAEKQYKNIKLLPFGVTFPYCMGCSKENGVLLGLLNKGLVRCDEAVLMDAMYAYIQAKTQYTLQDFVANNMLLSFTIVFVFFGVIFLMLWLFFKMRRAKELVETRDLKLVEALSGSYVNVYLIHVKAQTVEIIKVKSL